ncbi:hypothetical protein NT6N_24290 [Oceaniferula spumae]|uniref:DNA-binding protein n=1 Tax=Oceaniferula spumae TaxID=2979115 RepID=A0AAT9FN10_9BACT
MIANLVYSARLSSTFDNNNMKCNQCGSADLIEDVGVIDRGENNARWDLTLVTHRDPGAWVFKGAIEAPVRAKVCASCGYVMLFAKPSDVEQLRYGDPPLL